MIFRLCLWPSFLHIVFKSNKVNLSGLRLPKEELTQLINALIGNHTIKDILTKDPLSYTPEDYQRNQNQQRREALLNRY
jgi:hypothetical protein